MQGRLHRLEGHARSGSVQRDLTSGSASEPGVPVLELEARLEAKVEQMLHRERRTWQVESGRVQQEQRRSEQAIQGLGLWCKELVGQRSALEHKVQRQEALVAEAVQVAK